MRRSPMSIELLRKRPPSMRRTTGRLSGPVQHGLSLSDFCVFGASHKSSGRRRALRSAGPIRGNQSGAQWLRLLCQYMGGCGMIP